MRDCMYFAHGLNSLIFGTFSAKEARILELFARAPLRIWPILKHGLVRDRPYAGSSPP